MLIKQHKELLFLTHPVPRKWGSIKLGIQPHHPEMNSADSSALENQCASFDYKIPMGVHFGTSL